MMQHQPQNEDAEQTYRERDAVAIFDTEASLHAAIRELMQVGFRREDMNLLADAKALPGCGGTTPQVEQFEDKTPGAGHISPNERTAGLAALVALPMYAVGAGAAAIVATGAVTLIPTIAVVAGSGVAAGALGLMLARVFGHHHAARVQQQISDGGLLLWLHVPDNARDAKVVEVLKRHGGRDVHFHEVKRTWGVADIPSHDANPDPLIRD